MSHWELSQLSTCLQSLRTSATKSSPHPHFSQNSSVRPWGTALTATHSPSSTLPPRIPAPSMAQVHTPQGPSLFWATLAPHASASLPIKCPAYKTFFPVRLLQTLNRGRHEKILGLTPGTLSEDQLPSHLPCSCINPAPSYSISMVHVTPPSSCLQEHQRLQDTRSNLPRP